MKVVVGDDVFKLNALVLTKNVAAYAEYVATPEGAALEICASSSGGRAPSPPISA